MHCVNPTCGKPLNSGDKFCMYCGTLQPARETRPQPTQRPVDTRTSAQEHVETPSSVVEAHKEVLVMRAEERIWHFTESEGDVQPGQRRPLLLIDEQGVHLAHTDKRFDPQELLERVRCIITTQGVPVDVQLINARWLSDPREVRPRLIASLRDHPYSDLKMIMGVDYMGSWASIYLHVGVEPEPEPPEPEAPKWKKPIDAVAALICGAIFLVAGSSDALNSSAIAVVGVLSLGYGIVRFYISYKWYTTQVLAQKAAWAGTIAKDKLTKSAERLSRTFKVDDMRLFCTAMRKVFQAVVDDIVQRGAEVVRIEGGQGGFFQGAGVATPAPTPRRADASQAEV